MKGGRGDPKVSRDFAPPLDAVHVTTRLMAQMPSQRCHSETTQQPWNRPGGWVIEKVGNEDGGKGVKTSLGGLVTTLLKSQGRGRKREDKRRGNADRTDWQ